ncbi:MAG TPA: hypothetical protein VF505_11230 [Thermoanaerobaculia bacterium]
MKRAIAVTEVLLILPAMLFMTALFVRNLQPLQYEPARTAERIVMWYSERPHVGLWVLLMALPFSVLVSGCTTLLHRWKHEAGLPEAARQTLSVIRAHVLTLSVAAATLAAAGVLAIVAIHALTD